MESNAEEQGVWGGKDISAYRCIGAGDCRGSKFPLAEHKNEYDSGSFLARCSSQRSAKRQIQTGSPCQRMAAICQGIYPVEHQTGWATPYYNIAVFRSVVHPAPPQFVIATDIR